MKKVTKNLIWGFGGQLLTLAMNFILPRLILISYGSEINGLTSTITQIFTYIALLEAGIGNASKNCLYRFLAQNDQAGVSTTVSATKKYFRKITPLYSLCVLAFAIIYPFCVETEIARSTICLLVFIRGLSGVIEFALTNTNIQLLEADGRNYIVSNLALMVKAVSTSLQVVFIAMGLDIISVQLAFLVTCILKSIFVNIYIKRKYSWLVKDPNASVKMLEQRGAFVIHEISTVIFQNTDIFLISIFCSVTDASIYSIYNMVFIAISGIYNILFQSVDYRLGLEFHRNRGGYIKMHDTIEVIYTSFVFAVISTAYVLIIPFVQLYTEGVNDANYVQPLLPLLFCVIQILSASRAVASKLITVSGRARNTVPNTITEMLLNIVASIILIHFFGMPGALGGTIVALLYRTNDIIIYANRKILKRSSLRAYKTMAINIVLFALIILISKIVPVYITSYGEFILHGMIVLTLCLAWYYGIHLILNRDVREMFGAIAIRMKKIINLEARRGKV